MSSFQLGVLMGFEPPYFTYIFSTLNVHLVGDICILRPPSFESESNVLRAVSGPEKPWTLKQVSTFRLGKRKHGLKNWETAAVRTDQKRGLENGEKQSLGGAGKRKSTKVSLKVRSGKIMMLSMAYSKRRGHISRGEVVASHHITAIREYMVKPVTSRTNQRLQEI